MPAEIHESQVSVLEPQQQIPSYWQQKLATTKSATTAVLETMSAPNRTQTLILLHDCQAKNLNRQSTEPICKADQLLQQTYQTNLHAT